MYCFYSNKNYFYKKLIINFFDHLRKFEINMINSNYYEFKNICLIKNEKSFILVVDI